MKKQLPPLLLILFLLTYHTHAQNLVQNGNFEEYTQCPPGVSNLNYCKGWRQYTWTTSDFHHVCGYNGAHVPDNLFGHQYAASGKGYTGGYSFTDISIIDNWTEYLAGYVNPLIVGQTYEVSMSVSLADTSAYGNNGLGIWFYQNYPSTIGTNGPLKIKPQISFADHGVITEKKEWIRLSSKFTADSAYSNIVIGFFMPSTGLLTQYLPSRFADSYYYYDSVVVRPVLSINNFFNKSILCAGDTFYVPLTINTGVKINPENIFTAYLSNPSGSFQSGTTVIGTLQGSEAGSIRCIVPSDIQPGNNYHIRIMSSDTRDSSNPNLHPITIQSINMRAYVDFPVCTDSVIYIYCTSDSQNITYKWSGPNSYTSKDADNHIFGATAAIHNGKYIAVAQNKDCKFTAFVNVKVIEPVNLGTDDIFCVNETKLLKLDYDSASFLWQDGSTLNEFNITRPGKYWVTVNTHCGTYSDTVIKDYQNCECTPFVPSAFTPNGDSRNDKIAPILSCHVSEYKFLIVNRFGQVVFASTDPNEKWDGNFNGQPAEVGTYFYLLQLKGPRGKDFQFKGDITVIR